MSCCIVIPAYRPGPELAGYVRSLLELLHGPVVVVDDGSGPAYQPIFEEAGAIEGCVLLRHPENRGKGAGIKTAIRWYRAQKVHWAGIVTADCDGQHIPKDVAAVAAALEAQPDALVLGGRTFGPDTPKRSLMGNRAVSAVLAALYGIHLEDSQTGLRGLPHGLMPVLESLAGDRYEYELNMLLELHRRCVPFVTVPITTLYFDNNAGSHYRTVKDTLPIIRLLGKGLLQYIISSSLSALVDVAAYALLVKLVFAPLEFLQRLAVSAAIARLVSSVVNYGCNRRLPYVQEQRILPTAVRYYTLWAVQLLASILLSWSFCTLLHWDELWVKLLVDLLLAAASYQVQLRWVFRAAPSSLPEERTAP